MKSEETVYNGFGDTIVTIAMAKESFHHVQTEQSMCCVWTIFMTCLTFDVVPCCWWWRRCANIVLCQQKRVTMNEGLWAFWNERGLTTFSAAINPLIPVIQSIGHSIYSLIDIDLKIKVKSYIISEWCFYYSHI